MNLKPSILALAIAGALPLAAHAAPKVSFKAPLAGGTLAGDVQQNSRCEVTTSGDARRVVFWLDGSIQLNTEGSAPWNCNVDTTKYSDGAHRLKAVAYDARGGSASTEISVNFSNNNPPPGGGATTPPAGSTYLGLPYSGSAIVAPGTFAAADFDRGGQNVAYRDLSGGNAGGAYRTGEDVDIVASGDALTPYAVNGFQSGEWLAYTINVPASGSYDIAIRAASHYVTPGAFRIEIDGVDVSGAVSVPGTGGWATYQWVGKQGVALAAGTHVLKLVAMTEYFNVQALSILGSTATGTPTYGGTPYTGSPIALPKAFAAADFDRGGQGVAYRDMSAGNAGGVYRTGEDVDLFTTTDAMGTYGVNGFQKGEWLAYTVQVPQNGKYDLAINAATNSSTPTRFHIEVDGGDVTGPLTVPVTGGWSNFQWVGKQGVELAAGQRVLKVVADEEYFNLNSVSVLDAVALTPPTVPAAVQYACSFENSWTDCGFFEQAKTPGRAALVSTARDGSRAVRLHTEPGDTNVSGSGSWERNDLGLSQAATDCYEGKTAWWAHSVLFPSDYTAPPFGGVVMDFHHTGSTGQANFHVDAMYNGLRLRGYGGQSVDAGRYEVPLGAIQKNLWYDFVYYVKWSSGSDGFMHAWVNGVKKLTHYGPTLYRGMGCYLKLANYHEANGQPSSVIHDRVIRGATWRDVSLTPLEGIQ